MKNVDSSEGDFALLLLAEKQAAISKKIEEPTNEQANTQMLLKLYSIMRSYFRCFTTITRLINHSIDLSRVNQSIDRNRSITR